jgi:hypothetical protein
VEGAEEDCLGGPADAGGGLVGVEAGDVPQPDVDLDADRCSDGHGDRIEPCLVHRALQWGQGIGDPDEPAPLAQRQVSALAAGFEGEPQHRAQGRLGGAGDLGDLADHDPQPLQRVAGRIGCQQRGCGQLGMGRHQQRPLVGEVAVGGAASDAGRLGGGVDRRGGSLLDEADGGLDERGPGPGLLWFDGGLLTITVAAEDTGGAFAVFDYLATLPSPRSRLA